MKFFKIELEPGWKPPTIEKLKAIALHVFFPNRCMFCRKVVDYRSNMCDACTESIPDPPVPLVLGEITVYSPFFYGKGAENAVQDLKFDAYLDNAKKLAEYMTDILRDTGYDFDMLIPIPLHKKDLRKREFNQSELIATEIGKIVDIPVKADILIKTRRTKKQHNLGKIDRQLNLDGAFEVHKDVGDKIAKKHLLLIDDVCTTGTTFTKCAQVLLRAGATTVTGLSASMVQKRRIIERML